MAAKPSHQTDVVFERRYSIYLMGTFLVNQGEAWRAERKFGPVRSPERHECRVGKPGTQGSHGAQGG